MKNLKLNVLVLVIILAIVVVAYLGHISMAEPQEKGTIKIGATLPLTGVSSFYGQYPRRGMEIALKDINDQGGINGKPLEIIFEDTNSENTLAVNTLQRLISMEEATVILASASSPETIAQAPIAENMETVLIASGSAAPKIREAGDYIFRVKVAVDVEVKELLKFVSNKLKAEKIYILYVQNDYGQGLAEAANEYWQELGGVIVGEEAFELKENDYRTYLLKIKKEQPEVVVLVGWASNVGWILKQAQELDLKIPIVAPAGSIGPEVIEIAGSAADGLIYNTEFDSDNQSAVFQNFKIKYEQQYQTEPDLFSAMGYDATMIIAKMLGKCGQDSTCIKDELYKVKDYDGASGIISFDQNGDVIKPLNFIQIKDGKHVKYEALK